ncbi:conserved hypothetical protein [Ricinus communis]|uniref:Uncharacterized protein n=1 Tax=Ricinus communis TaxID=3988 RepID=B9RU11_RICCO|nr:conserved hypothetical protein [Ricinus communis]
MQREKPHHHLIFPSAPSLAAIDITLTITDKQINSLNNHPTIMLLSSFVRATSSPPLFLTRVISSSLLLTFAQLAITTPSLSCQPLPFNSPPIAATTPTTILHTQMVTHIYMLMAIEFLPF